MQEIVKCTRCGIEISNIYTADYYRHIRKKYCDTCRVFVRREQTALRVYNLRQRKKQKDQFRDEQLVLLAEQVELIKKENELLKKRLICINENTPPLKK